MLRHADCERYRQWKKQQDVLLKGPKRKIKKKVKKDRKEIMDCIEEEKQEKPKTILKIRYRKCTQKETQKPKKDPSFKPKPVSSIDLLFKRIQPSLEVRQQLLIDRHADCFTETVPEIDLTALKEASLSTTRTKIVTAGKKRKRSRRRKKDKVETTISEEDKVKTAEKEEVAQEREETVNEEESDEKEKEKVEETIEEKENIREEDDARAIDDKDDEREVKRKKKDKFWCKKFKRKIDYESEDSECESICSFDSDICLKGLALTSEDKKKIKENQRNVRASSST